VPARRGRENARRAGPAPRAPSAAHGSAAGRARCRRAGGRDTSGPPSGWGTSPETPVAAWLHVGRPPRLPLWNIRSYPPGRLRHAKIRDSERGHRGGGHRHAAVEAGVGARDSVAVGVPPAPSFDSDLACGAQSDSAAGARPAKLGWSSSADRTFGQHVVHGFYLGVVRLIWFLHFTLPPGLGVPVPGPRAPVRQGVCRARWRSASCRPQC
jgi:hypothetical protein